LKLIIISGRSGSGKSIALRALEDLGYYCVDNIPVNLLPTLTHTVVDEYDHVAVSIDVRNLPRDPSELVEILDYLPSSWSMTIVYIDASDDMLVKRFSETRRLHPLTRLNKSLSEAIRAESDLLAPIAERADLYIDTDSLSVHC
jgi:RNase adapter protein RapZ